MCLLVQVEEWRAAFNGSNSCCRRLCGWTAGGWTQVEAASASASAAVNSTAIRRAGAGRTSRLTRATPTATPGRTSRLVAQEALQWSTRLRRSFRRAASHSHLLRRHWRRSPAEMRARRSALAAMCSRHSRPALPVGHRWRTGARRPATAANRGLESSSNPYWTIRPILNDAFLVFFALVISCAFTS